MWIVLAYTSLGFVIGNLVGLSAESVTSSILALLFAFGGGSAIAFVQKLDAASRKIASIAILSLSLSCLIGVYLGIGISEHQILSPQTEPSVQRSSIESRKYLRENLASKANAIDHRYQNEQISLQNAYDNLYELIREKEWTQ